jgi:hypothetical protein
VNDSYFENRDAFKAFPQLVPTNERMAVKSMPSFNVDSLLEEDKELEALGGYPFRFGYAFDVNYALEDGRWLNDGDRNVWSLRFRSNNAYSLNFGFSQLALAPGAELYVFSTDGSMVYGPVTEVQNTTDGWLYTIPVSGEDVVVQLIEPASIKGQSLFTVSQVIHGYKNVVPSPNELPSLTCYNDVCSYSGYTDYSDAVCRILNSGSSICTGALLNNTSQNYTPYVLTAHHCIGTGEPASWTFQFRYKSCTTSVSFNYADAKAAWEQDSGTDLLLVQLRSALGDQDLLFLGWDRTSTAPSSGTTIHHPAGNQMKISFANSAFSAYTPTSATSSNNYWLGTFNSGSAEPGSSGAPLLNANNQVVGQMRGSTVPSPVCPPVPLIFGRFDHSWTGNGTAATRLRDWLDPNTTGVQALNFLPLFTFNGPDLVPCSGTVTYTIPQTRATSATSITWSVGTGLEIVSGGSTRTVTVSRSGSVPSAGVNVSITYGGVTKVLSKQVDIGSPKITGITGPSSVPISSSAVFYAEPYFAANQGNYEWSVPNATFTSNREMCTVSFPYTGTFQVGVRSTSSCTTPGTYTWKNVSVTLSYIVSSGTNKLVSVSPQTGDGADPSRTIGYTLYDQETGVFVRAGRLSVQGGNLDFSSVPAGIYLLRLDTGTGTFDTHRVLLK